MRPLLLLFMLCLASPAWAELPRIIINRGHHVVVPNKPTTEEIMRSIEERETQQYLPSQNLTASQMEQIIDEKNAELVDKLQYKNKKIPKMDTDEEPTNSAFGPVGGLGTVGGIGNVRK